MDLLLYISIIDHEKAFDSVNRETLWKIQRGVKNCYEGIGLQCNRWTVAKSFSVKTTVRQGCLLFPFLFLIAFDWIIKTCTTQRRNGIHAMDDQDFTDDLALLSHTQQHTQDNTVHLGATHLLIRKPQHSEKSSN